MLEFLTGFEPIDEANYNYEMKTRVEPYLAKRRRDGNLVCADGKSLHYEAYEKLLSRGSIVVLHGFCESAEKMREMTYYLRRAGYSVYALDLRGHGHSFQQSAKQERVEIDCFDEYAEDLNLFIETVVKPVTVGKIHIYSHSLGSTVALLYMMKYTYAVDKAVLSSPMICGNMGMPVAVAGTVAKMLCAFGGKKISAPGRCVFNSEQTADDSDATSIARFNYYHEKRKNQPLYQTSGPSFGWVKASIEARDKILNKKALEMISAKMLIFKPEQDRQLLSSYTEKFADMADVKIKNVKNSRHEIFMSRNDVMKWYVGEILEFFGE